MTALIVGTWLMLDPWLMLNSWLMVDAWESCWTPPPAPVPGGSQLAWPNVAAPSTC